MTITPLLALAVVALLVPGCTPSEEPPPQIDTLTFPEAALFQSAKLLTDTETCRLVCFAAAIAPEGVALRDQSLTSCTPTCPRPVKHTARAVTRRPDSVFSGVDVSIAFIQERDGKRDVRTMILDPTGIRAGG